MNRLLLAAVAFALAGVAQAQVPRGCGPHDQCQPQQPPIVMSQDIQFTSGYTIDLQDVTPSVGRLRGFVIVSVKGEPLLMPVYTVHGDPRVFRILANAPLCQAMTIEPAAGAIERV